jgi:hypothetical protein
MRKNVPQDSRGPGKGAATPLLRCFCHARVRFSAAVGLVPFRRPAGWMDVAQGRTARQAGTSGRSVR